MTTTHTDPVAALFAATPETRQAYMMLYRTYAEGADSWPARLFGAEIETLLCQGHARHEGSGYALTDEGVRLWQAYVKAHTTPQGNRQDAPDRLMILLLTRLSDGAWHETSTLIEVLGTEYNVAACRAYGSKQGLLMLKRVLRRGYAQITDKGRKWVEGMTREG